MPNEKYILTIDLGTSGPKVALFSTGGEVVGWEFEPVPLYLFPNGGAEQNPQEWWHAIVKAEQRLLARRLVPVEDIVALCCTAQWSGTVAVDRNGDPLMNAVIWMDMRGAPYIQQITGGPLNLEGYDIRKLFTWIRLTGGIPAQSGKDPIAHILYLKHECPDIYQKTFKFLEPKDYLNLRLTGQLAASYDSICLHWVTDNRDIKHVVYNDQLLWLSGLDRDKLPDLKQAADVLGPLKPEVAAELGLSPKVQVIMGTPDVQSAAIGAGAVQDYQAHLYLGTSSWLVCHVPHKKTDLFHNVAALPSALPGKYLLTNEQESACACLNYLRDNLLYPADELAVGEKPADYYNILNRVAATAPAGSEGLIFTPWLYGERAPVDDHSVRGGFFNQSLKTTRAHLVRSVFEGVAYNSRWLLGAIEQFIGRQLEAVNVVGGGAISDLWCQIYADVFNRPIRQVKEPRLANARGAAFLASLALGYLAVDDIPQRIQIANTFTPNPANRQIYDELFGEFVNLYKANKAIYARLNKS